MWTVPWLLLPFQLTVTLRGRGPKCRTPVPSAPLPSPCLASTTSTTPTTTAQGSPLFHYHNQTIVDHYTRQYNIAIAADDPQHLPPKTSTQMSPWLPMPSVLQNHPSVLPDKSPPSSRASYVHPSMPQRQLPTFTQASNQVSSSAYPSSGMLPTS